MKKVCFVADRFFWEEEMDDLLYQEINKISNEDHIIEFYFHTCHEVFTQRAVGCIQKLKEKRPEKQLSIVAVIDPLKWGEAAYNEEILFRYDQFPRGSVDRIDLAPVSYTHLDVYKRQIVAGGEHTTRATRLIQYGDDLSVIENIITAGCQQDIDHQLDKISAGVVIASFRIFRKSADQVFKYVTHFHVVNGVRIEIQLRERLYYREQSVVLVHLVDLLVKVQATDDVLNIGREALDVCLTVGRQVV